MSDLLRRTLGEQITVETVLAGGLWRTHVDPNQLESAILNLAVNSRDAMPDGGKLTIETANTHLDERYAASQAEVAPGQYVALAITDNGAGMAQGGPRARVRAVLHDQGHRPGHRARPLPGLRLRQAVGRTRQDLQRARRGHDGQASTCRGCTARTRQAGARRVRRASVAGTPRRDHPGGRGRRRRARAFDAAPGASSATACSRRRTARPRSRSSPARPRSSCCSPTSACPAA